MSLFDAAHQSEESVGRYIVLRCKLSYYMRGTTFVTAQELRPIVRWSCPNTLTQWHEDISMVGPEEHSNGLKFFSKLEEGRLYKVYIGEMHRDWETGYVDDWSWHVKAIEPEEESKHTVSHPLWREQLRENRKREQEADDE